MQPAATANDLPTACVLCSHNCSLRVDVTDNRITAVRGDDTSPITHGYLCNKAFAIPHYVQHKQRVTQPLKRQPDGSHAPISWTQAIAEIGGKLARIRGAHGDHSLALIGVGGQGNHLDGPFALGWLMASGSPWWFNALAQEKTQHALVDGWMFGDRSDAYLHADAEHSQDLLVMGTNPLVSNRGRNPVALFKALAADPTRTLVVVDPRRSETARKADLHVVVRPGTDTYFLLGMAAVIVRERLVDDGFVAATATGQREVETLLETIDPADMAARAGVPQAQLADVARGFAAAESASIFFDLGVEQAPFSTLNSYLIRLLALLTGNLGIRGGNVFHGTFSPRTKRIDKKPFRAPVSGIASIAMLAPFGMFSPNLLAEEITAPRGDRIRALICEGANPMIQAAGLGTLRSAMGQLELLVVIDPAFSETAALADYVLPAPVGYEKWEYAGFPKHYPAIQAQVRPPVVTGPPDALQEAEIFLRIAQASGVMPPAPKLLHWLARGARTAAGATAYLAAAAAAAAVSGRNPYRAFARVVFWTYETVGKQLPAPALSAMWMLSHLYALTRRDDVLRAWPELSRHRVPGALGEQIFAKLLAHPEGVEVGRLDEARNLEDHVSHPGGKVRVAVPEMLSEIRRALAAAPAEPGGEFPLILNGGQRTHWNANTIQRDPAWRKGKGPHCGVSLHPDDAARLEISDGMLCDVTTARGRVQLPAIVDAAVSAGNVLIPNGFGLRYPDASGVLQATGIAINELTDAQDRDPFTGCPHHKTIRCRVTPAS